MTKKFLVLSRKRMRFYTVLAVLGLSLIFSGCPTDAAEDRHPAYGTPPYSGPATGEESGYHDGGPTTIKITLTLEEGYITTVSYEGSTGITNGIGSQVRDNAPSQIIARNSFDIDVFSGASVTRDLTIKAGKKALNTISGVNVD
jgi:uncharacterized protein with FMN-binding domain